VSTKADVPSATLSPRAPLRTPQRTPY
jgi:hypothetical protein